MFVSARGGGFGVKLVPVSVDLTTAARRVGGQNLLGITYIAPDFDAPMTEEELKEWGY